MKSRSSSGRNLSRTFQERRKPPFAPRIATRRELLKLRKEWLQGAEIEFTQFGSLNSNERWPTIADRFAQIGEAVAYRTAYARLSSQTHADMEDTLNYIFFRVGGDDQLFVQVSQETLAFTEYLVAYSTEFYFSAMVRLCEAFRLDTSAEFDYAISEIGPNE